MSTGSGLFVLGQLFSPYFCADRLCKGIEKLSNAHLIVSRKMASLPVNVRRSKTPLLKFPTMRHMYTFSLSYRSVYTSLD